MEEKYSALIYCSAVLFIVVLALILCCYYQRKKKVLRWKRARNHNQACLADRIFIARQIVSSLLQYIRDDETVGAITDKEFRRMERVFSNEANEALKEILKDNATAGFDQFLETKPDSFLVLCVLLLYIRSLGVLPITLLASLDYRSIQDVFEKTHLENKTIYYVFVSTLKCLHELIVKKITESDLNDELFREFAMLFYEAFFFGGLSNKKQSNRAESEEFEEESNATINYNRISYNYENNFFLAVLRKNIQIRFEQNEDILKDDDYFFY